MASRCLLAVAGLAAGLAAAEAGARLAGVRPSWLDPALFVPLEPTVYGLRPGFRGLYAGAPVRVNAQGFRGPEPARDSASFRILLLGDSVAFGQGVAEDETVAAILAHRARARGMDVEVVNAAVPGFNTANEAAWLGAIGDRIRPDLVLLLFVDNDAEPQLFVGFRDGVPVTAAGRYQTRRDLIGLASAWLYAHSAAYNAVRLALRRLSAGEESEDAYRRRMAAAFVPQAPGFQSAAGALERIRDWCRQRGVPLLVAVWSKLAPDDPDPYADAVEAECRRRGIRCVRVHTRRPGEDPGRTTLAWDGHPNGLGHRRLAGAIFRRLVQEGVLRTTRQGRGG